MEVATAKEARALTNKTKAITPGTLREVLSSYATKEYADTHGGGGGGSGLVDDVKVNGVSVVTNKIANVSVPTSLSQLANDAHYVQTVNNYIPDNMISDTIKQQIVEAETQAALPNPGQPGKIYIVKNSNKLYRYADNSYIELSETLQLGETSSTAYRGDRGKTAYDHSQIVNGNPHGLTLNTFGISVSATEINYLSGLSKNIVTAFGEKLNLTGGVMTGYLTLNSLPALDMHAAPKKYVDNAIYTVAITVHQKVNHFNNIVDTINQHSESIGLATDALIQVNNKVQGYSFEKYIEKDFVEQTGTFGINVEYFIKDNDTYIAVPYNSETHKYTINQIDYNEGDPIPETIHLYIISGDYDVGDPIVPTLSPDITYKEDINYYEKSNNTFIPISDYVINSEVPEDTYCDNTYEKITTINYSLTKDTKYKAGSQYWMQNYTPTPTADSKFLDNKMYFKYDGTNYITLIPIIDYNVNDSISVVPGTVYEKGYDGTYYSLTEGTDYNPGDYILDTVYQKIATEEYILTSDTTFNSNKEYYYRVLSSGIDTILQTQKENIATIIQEEGRISGTVATIDSFINDNIKNEDGLIAQVNKAKGELGKLEIDVTDVISKQSSLNDSVIKLLGANASMQASLTTLERRTNNFSTDSYSKTEVQKIIDGVGHFITRDAVYMDNRTYYIMDGTTNTWRELMPDEYTIGDPIPDNIVYEYGKTKVVSSESGKFDEDGLLIATEEMYGYEYKKTKDIYFQPAKHYYISDGQGSYTQVYSLHIVPSSDDTYSQSKTYYLIDNGQFVIYNPYEYFLTKDIVYTQGKTYYILNSLGNYQEVSPYVYTLTSDTTFVADKKYYKKNENNKYILFTEYTVGDSITPNTIYEYTSGNYYIDDQIPENTTYEKEVNYEYNDPVDPNISLYELTGDYTIGDLCSTFELTLDTVVQENKEYYSKVEEAGKISYKNEQLVVGTSIIPGVYYERDTNYYNEDEEKTKFTSETIGRYNEKGMRIRKVSDQLHEETNEEILYAGVDENNSAKSIVRTINLKVKDYLYAAGDSNSNSHMRIEAFKKDANTPTGWGMFYL